MKTRILFCTAVLVLQFAPCAVSAISDLEAREKAKEAVRQEAKRGDGSLHTKRVEDFEGEFLNYQVSIYEGTVAKGIYVYEMSEAGCDPELNEKGSRSCSIVMDADPRWYVAVSRESGVAYRISGFEDSRQEFNRMASDLHVRLFKPDDAKNYGLFFLSLYFGPKSDMEGPQVRPVDTDYSVRRLAEDDFHWNYKETEYEGHFNSWWNQFKKERPKLDLAAKSVAYGEVYEVSLSAIKLMSFSVPPFKRLENEPMLVRIKLRISRKGTIDEMELTKLFR